MRFLSMSALSLAVVAGLCGGCAKMSGPLFEAPPGEVGAVDTGTFPNLNNPPQVAATQIASDEKAARQQALAGAQASQVQAAPPPPSRSNEELRRIAADKGQSTLDAIAAQ